MLNDSPVLILGITGRSGTNFLWRLICQHPDFEKSHIPEDYLIAESPRLVEFADKVYKHWLRWLPENPGAERSLFIERLSQGAISHLASHSNGHKRLVLKTPSVSNIDQFPILFPASPLLILVRDGRAVVESSMMSFGWAFEPSLRRWVSGARKIHGFTTSQPSTQTRYLVVRYEDLVLNLTDEMCRILTFLDADIGAYDFDAASKLVVTGSSRLRGDIDQVHWNPMARTSDFRPMGHWGEWSRYRIQRCNWLAARWLDEFGYPVSCGRVNCSGPHAGQEHIYLPWKVVNILADFWMSTRTRLFRSSWHQLSLIGRSLWMVVRTRNRGGKRQVRR